MIAQLRDQISGAFGYRFPCLEEEATECVSVRGESSLGSRADVDSFLTLLSSWSNSVPLLHPADRAYFGFLGAYHLKFDSTCRDVLVLLSSGARHSNLVERVDHQTPDHTICHRPW